MVADLLPIEESTGLVIGIVAALVGILLFISLESSAIWLRVIAYLIAVLMFLFGVVNIIFSFL